jgi:hypothetical protein
VSDQKGAQCPGYGWRNDGGANSNEGLELEEIKKSLNVFRSEIRKSSKKTDSVKYLKNIERYLNKLQQSQKESPLAELLRNTNSIETSSGAIATVFVWIPLALLIAGGLFILLNSS